MTAEHILNEAIDKIIQEDQAGLDALLAAHPEVRSEIEPLLEIAQQLSAALPVEAPQAFVLATRRQLILRAAARRTAMQKRPSRGFSLPKLLGMRRLAYTVVALVVALALILGSGGVATAQSLPGQPLYGAKRAAEDAPLSFISDVFVRADYLLTLLDRRVYEVDLLSQLDAINEIAFTEVRLATERAVVAVQAVPLDRAVAQWTRLEEITTRQGLVLTQIAEKGQLSAATEAAFAQAWQVCTATQTQARAMLSTLPRGLTKTPEPPGLTRTPEPTNTPWPSSTPEPSHTPRPSNTPEPTRPTAMPEPTQQPPGLTNTPQPPGLTNTPQPPGLTNTPQPPGQTKTPEPPGQTKTPEPPGQTKEPKPTKTPK